MEELLGDPRHKLVLWVLIETRRRKLTLALLARPLRWRLIAFFGRYLVLDSSAEEPDPLKAYLCDCRAPGLQLSMRMFPCRVVLSKLSYSGVRQ